MTPKSDIPTKIHRGSGKQRLRSNDIGQESDCSGTAYEQQYSDPQSNHLRGYANHHRADQETGIASGRRHRDAIFRR